MSPAAAPRQAMSVLCDAVYDVATWCHRLRAVFEQVLRLSFNSAASVRIHSLQPLHRVDDSPAQTVIVFEALGLDAAVRSTLADLLAAAEHSLRAVDPSLRLAGFVRSRRSRVCRNADYQTAIVVDELVTVGFICGATAAAGQ